MQKQQDQGGSAAGGMSGGLAAGRQQSDSEQSRADKGKNGGKPADEKQTGKEKQQNACRRHQKRQINNHRAGNTGRVKPGYLRQFCCLDFRNDKIHDYQPQVDGDKQKAENGAVVKQKNRGRQQNEKDNQRHFCSSSSRNFLISRPPP